MKKNLIKIIFSVAIRSLSLFMVGFVISFIKGEALASLKDILFWVGAIPIALFSFGLFNSTSSSNVHLTLLSHSTNDQSPNQRALQTEHESRSKLATAIPWILSGLTVWLISYFL